MGDRSDRPHTRHRLRGTPAYIAPEQALGGSAVDGRADIYAVGCVAYFLLTGQLVFTGDTPMAVVVHHAHTPPTPPSERSELPIPPALDRLVMVCLAKNPAERPQSARDLSRRLAEVGGWSNGPKTARGSGGTPTSPATELTRSPGSYGSSKLGPYICGTVDPIARRYVVICPRWWTMSKRKLQAIGDAGR